MDREDKLTLGERLRELRQDREMSQDDVGKLFGVDRSTISQWEDNVTKPRIEKFPELARYFNVSVDFLLGVEPTDYNEEYNELIAKIAGRSITINDFVMEMKLLDSTKRTLLVKVLFALREDLPIDLKSVIESIKIPPSK